MRTYIKARTCQVGPPAEPGVIYRNSVSAITGDYDITEPVLARPPCAGMFTTSGYNGPFVSNMHYLSDMDKIYIQEIVDILVEGYRSGKMRDRKRHSLFIRACEMIGKDRSERDGYKRKVSDDFPMTRSKKRALEAGVMFGLALQKKINEFHKLTTDYRGEHKILWRTFFWHQIRHGRRKGRGWCYAEGYRYARQYYCNAHTDRLKQIRDSLLRHKHYVLTPRKSNNGHASKLNISRVFTVSNKIPIKSSTPNAHKSTSTISTLTTSSGLLIDVPVSNTYRKEDNISHSSETEIRVDPPPEEPVEEDFGWEEGYSPPIISEEERNAREIEAARQREEDEAAEALFWEEARKRSAAYLEEVRQENERKKAEWAEYDRLHAHEQEAYRREEAERIARLNDWNSREEEESADGEWE